MGRLGRAPGSSRHWPRNRRLCPAPRSSVGRRPGVARLCLLLAAWACGGPSPGLARAIPDTRLERGGGCAGGAREAGAASLGPSGSLRGVRLASERPDTGRSRRTTISLVLNVPAYRLDLFEDGVLTRSYGVAVGARQYPTPTGSYSITQLEWNPWWVPPAADWARDEVVTPPGWNNPMGRVKLHFRPYYFLHGTPLEESIGSAASHGCVRMANADAIALARIVQRNGVPGVSDSTIDSLLADTSRTRRYELAEPVPLDIRYDVAELRHDSLWLYPDVYRLVRGRLAERALAVLAEAGFDTTAVDRARLSAAAREATRRATGVALEELALRASGERAPDHTATRRRCTATAGGGELRPPGRAGGLDRDHILDLPVRRTTLGSRCGGPHAEQDSTRSGREGTEEALVPL